MADFTISGRGSTEKIADNALARAKGQLEKKLSNAQVSSELSVVRTVYELILTPKKGNAKSRPTTLNSEVGWNNLSPDPVKVASSKAQYHVEQYFDLNAEQLKVVSPRRSPAGPIYSDRPSALSSYNLDRLL